MDSSKPAAAFSATYGEAHALVAWVPGAVAADVYRVYGIDGERMIPLSWVPAGDYSADVASGFATYAVTGIVGGAESAPTLAPDLGGSPAVPCVEADPGPPPGVAVGCTKDIIDLPVDPVGIWIR